MEKKDNSYQDLKYILFLPPVAAAGFVFLFNAIGRELIWVENIIYFINASLILSFMTACNYRYFTRKKNYLLLEPILSFLILFLFALNLTDPWSWRHFFSYIFVAIIFLFSKNPSNYVRANNKNE